MSSILAALPRPTPAAADPFGPPFTQCPAVGYDTSCGTLIVINGDGTKSIFTDPSQGPYDGIDDTLVGVQNNSSKTVTELPLFSTGNIFGFDGDGLCASGTSPRPSGCPFGPTGYEGPGTSFLGISNDHKSGFVSFTPGLAPGGSAYFSLETDGVTVSDPVSVLTRLGAQNFATNIKECQKAEPINCATGNFFHTFSDLSIPGRSPGLHQERTYNAVDAATDTPLGYGWSSTYTMGAVIDSISGAVTVRQENGSRTTFNPTGGAIYHTPSWVFALFVKNPDGTFTLTRRLRETFHFSATGRLLSVADPNGHTTTLAYDGAGQLTSVTDEAGRILVVAHNPNGKISSVTDPSGRHVSFTYDGAGNLTSATDVAGRVTNFAYDAAHRMTTMTDPSGGVVTNVYDSSDRVTSQTDRMGRTTTFAYGPTTTTITDPKGNVETQTYEAGLLTSLTKGVGTASEATWTYGYDHTTLSQTSDTDPNNHTTTRTWDARGNMTKVTDPLGRNVLFTYDDEQNNLTSAKDAAGVTTTFVYDEEGNLLSRSRPLVGSGQTQVTSFVYGDPGHLGDLTGMTDPNGKVWTFGYDGVGNLNSATDPLGNRTTYGYDVIGRQTSTVSPRGNAVGGAPTSHATTYAYNAFGDLTTFTDELGHVTTRAYDANRNLTALTDPEGRSTQYVYDAGDEVTSVTRADGSQLAFSYDANGNTVSKQDGQGHATTSAYDPLDRIVAASDPLARTTTFTYDAAGNRTALRDPAGQVTTFAYDAANQLTGIAYSDATTPNVSFAYDANGRRTSMTDGTGTSTYTWDSLSRLIQSRNGAGQVVGYGYDLKGQKTSIIYPGSRSVTQAYDDAGRMVSINDWLGHTTAFTYDADSNPTGQAYPNATAATFGFDNADRLMSITDTRATTTLASFTYTRDDTDQLTSLQPTGVPQGNESYAYTALNQLASVNGQAYDYDPSDNLTRLTSGTTLSYDAANEATAVGPIPLAYDARGNRTQAGTAPTAVTYAYDQANRLTSASAPAAAVPVLAAGQQHSLALRSDGTVAGWGKNAQAQLGNGTSADSSTAMPIPGLTAVRAIDGGLYHSVATRSDGTAWAWGGNGYGQLGNGTTAATSVPVPVAGLTGVKAAAAGCFHSLALRPDGTVWAWGANRAGQLGNGTTTDSAVPVQVSGLTGITEVSAGCYHSMALRNDGTVWTWGDNVYGQLGNGTNLNSAVPVQVGNNLNGVTAVSAGDYFNLVRISDGTVWAWGDNFYGQLGNGTRIGSSLPLPVLGLGNSVIAVAAGGYHSLALLADKTVQSWGENTNGQLGIGTVGFSNALPVTVSGLTAATAIAAGRDHSLAARSDGSVMGWGGNYFGQVGNGAPLHTSAKAAVPVAVAGLGAVRPIGAASYTYAGDGLRASKTVAGATTPFTYDVTGSLPLLLTEGSTAYVYGPGGLPLEQIDGSGRVLYYHQDQLGSTRLLTDAAGMVAATYTYDSYGIPTASTAPAAIANPFGYAGQYTDAETGFQQLRARYYDPATAQFLTRDPLVGQTGVPYGYSGSNPLNYVDPSGLNKCEVGLNPLRWGGNAQACGDDAWDAGYEATTDAADDLWDATGGQAVSWVNDNPGKALTYTALALGTTAFIIGTGGVGGVFTASFAGTASTWLGVGSTLATAGATYFDCQTGAGPCAAGFAEISGGVASTLLGIVPGGRFVKLVLGPGVGLFYDTAGLFNGTLAC